MLETLHFVLEDVFFRIWSRGESKTKIAVGINVTDSVLFVCVVGAIAGAPRHKLLVNFSSALFAHCLVNYSICAACLVPAVNTEKKDS